MSDPALERLERAYKASQAEPDRLAWVAGLLSRELLKGNDIRLGNVAGKPKDRWWYVADYRPPTFSYIMPGLTRPLTNGYMSLVQVHKARHMLLPKEWDCGVVPEFFISHLIDWRPSRVVIKP